MTETGIDQLDAAVVDLIGVGVAECLQSNDPQAKLKEFKGQLKSKLQEQSKMTATPAASIYGMQITDDAHVRVKGAEEAFSTVKTHAVGKNGKPAFFRRADDPIPQPVLTFSDREKAVTCAWFKRTAQKLFGADVVRLTERDKALLLASSQRDSWSSETETIEPGARLKALLDDSTSGGATLVPDFLDQQIVSPALLHSELAPECELEEIPRGSTVVTPTMAHITLTNGRTQGNSLTPVTAASLIDSLSTDIPNLEASIELDLDFLNDSNPIRVTDKLLENVGEKFAEDLDRQIAVGVGGTTECLGIFETSGLGDASPASPAGSLALSDVSALLFSVGAAYRKRFGCFFISNSTRYEDVRSLRTGVSGDNQLLFGLGIESYNVFDRPWRLQEDIPNHSIAFGCLGKYRLFRRLGMQVVQDDSGRTLRLKNQRLIVVRTRVGGRIVDPLAFGVTTGIVAA